MRIVLDMLPPDSAFWRATRKADDWSPTEIMLADVFDVLALGNWQRAGSDKNPRPVPYPRPWVVKEKKTKLQRNAEIALARLKAQQAKAKE